MPDNGMAEARQTLKCRLPTGQPATRRGKCTEPARWLVRKLQLGAVMPTIPKLGRSARFYIRGIPRLDASSLSMKRLRRLRRLRIFGQEDKLRADRSKGRETWA